MANPNPLSRRANRSIREGTIWFFLLICAIVSIVATAGIVWVLFTEAGAFFTTPYLAPVGLELEHQVDNLSVKASASTVDITDNIKGEVAEPIPVVDPADDIDGATSGTLAGTGIKVIGIGAYGANNAGIPKSPELIKRRSDVDAVQLFIAGSRSPYYTTAGEQVYGALYFNTDNQAYVLQLWFDTYLDDRVAKHVAELADPDLADTGRKGLLELGTHALPHLQTWRDGGLELLQAKLEKLETRIETVKNEPAMVESLTGEADGIKAQIAGYDAVGPALEELAEKIISEGKRAPHVERGAMTQIRYEATADISLAVDVLTLSACTVPGSGTIEIDAWLRRTIADANHNPAVAENKAAEPGMKLNGTGVLVGGIGSYGENGENIPTTSEAMSKAAHVARVRVGDAVSGQDLLNEEGEPIFAVLFFNEDNGKYYARFFQAHDDKLVPHTWGPEEHHFLDLIVPIGREAGVGEFVTSDQWNGLIAPDFKWGVWPLVSGTMLVAVGAAIIAIPLGVGGGIYMAEYASRRSRMVLKPLLEILAGVPTVVYGYFAFTAVTPFLQDVFGQDVEAFNSASAAIVVGIMVLPMVASLSDDALRAVPRALRDGAYSLGATKFEVSWRVVTPAALSGILASFVLAISRAIGETMAVTLAAGNTPKITLNPGESVQTMTTYMVQVATGDQTAESVQYLSLYAVGLALFFMTLFMNLVGHFVLRKFREVYD